MDQIDFNLKLQITSSEITIVTPGGSTYSWKRADNLPVTLATITKSCLSEMSNLCIRIGSDIEKHTNATKD